MANYNLSEDARADLISIHQYGVRSFGEAQADRYFWDLFEHLEKLSAAPEQYQRVDELRHGYRRSVCGSHSIYFRVNDGVSEIMAILRSQDRVTRL